MLNDYRITKTNSERFLVFLITLLICTSRGVAEDPDEFYRELSLSRTGDLQASSETAVAPRLTDILRMKGSFSDNEPASEGTVTNNSQELLAVHGQRKRVFCNGFTGCGGRYRERRRLQLPETELDNHFPIFSKRPFCNSYGCYNSGRKRFSNSRVPSNEKSQLSQHKEVRDADDIVSWARSKKLFCNGYGGCQNLGKRLARLNAEVAQGIDHRSRLLNPLSKSTSSRTEEKRFFTSSLEDDFDDLKNNVRRVHGIDVRREVLDNGFSPFVPGVRPVGFRTAMQLNIAPRYPKYRAN